MPWPLSQDYNEAIQSPSHFSDPELKAGQPVTNAMGIPRPCAGNFADVYEFVCPEARWAIKCFTRETPGLRERYAEVARFLEQTRLPFAVEFRYLEEGIRLRGTWYPLVKMRWVAGTLLNEFVRDNLHKPARLQALSQVWGRMARRLREAGLAHADLQHGNVILVPGGATNSLAIKLVDYDGMCVPALAKRKSGEVGHPNYQHPQRLREGSYGVEVDRFAVLVVATALQALTVGGQDLWDRYDNGDNLLFKETDFQSPAQSPLFQELLAGGDAETRTLAKRLMNAALRPLDECPLLEEPSPSPPIAPPVAPPVRTRQPARAIPVARPVRDEEEQPAPATSSNALIMALIGGAVAGSMLLVALVVGVLLLWLPRSTREKPNPDPVVAVETDKDKKPADPPPTDGNNKKDRDGKSAPLPTPPDEPKVKPTDTPRAPRFEGHKGKVYAVTFSPDGKQLVSGGHDQTARLWDRATGKTLQEFTGHTAEVMAAVFAPDAARVATASADKSVRLWDARTGNQLAVFAGHQGPIKSLAFSPDGRRLLSCSDDNTMRLWDVETGVPLRRFDHPSWARRCGFSPDGRYAVSSCGDGNVRVWAVETGKVFRTLAGKGDLFSCAFLPDGHRVVADSSDQIVRVWDVSSGRVLHQLSGHQGIVHALAVSPDNQHALSAGQDKIIRLWDLKAGRERSRISQESPHTLAISPDGQYGLSGSDDGPLHLWRLPLDKVAVVAYQAPREPDADAQVAATQKIKERYQAEYALQGIKAREALAAKLLDEGLAGSDDPGFRFAALREARDLAAIAGEYPQCRRAVEEMGFAFASDELGGLTDAVLVAGKSPVADRAVVATATLELAAEVAAADRFGLADALLNQATSIVQASKNANLGTLTAALRKRIAALARDYDEVKASALTLTRQPNDPEANLAVGKYQCFRKEDWARGLPHLAAGSDALLAGVARKDLAAPATPVEQAELGREWLVASEKQDAALRPVPRARGRAYLYSALPRLTGLDKAKAEDRLKVPIGKSVGKPGVVAELFADETLTKKVKNRIDYQIGFNWGFSGPDEGIAADHFSVRWRGWLYPARRGTYTLIIHADDAARLYLADKLIIDTGAKGGRHTQTLFLEDKPIRLQVEYREGIGAALMHFGWIPPGGRESGVPTEALFHDLQQEKLLAK